MRYAQQIRRIARFGWKVAAIGSVCILSVATAGESLAPVAEYQHLAQPLVERYCFDCHSGDAPDAGLSLERLDGGAQFQQHRPEWKKVLDHLRSGAMPPEDSEMPTDAEREQLAGWVEARLAEFRCDGPIDPGWVTLRRLNRDQYRNTVRDLLGVDFDPRASFPPDTLAYGFDNNADILSMTPLLLEKYLDAAHEIAGRAIVTPESIQEPRYEIPAKRWRGGALRYDGSRGLYSETRIEVDYHFPAKGRYLLRATVSGDQAGDEPVRMGFVDQGEVVKRVDIRSTSDESEVTQVEILIAEKGNRVVGVAFLNDFYIAKSPGIQAQDRNLRVHKIEILGPIDSVMRAGPTGHRRWFVTGPTPEEWKSDSWKPAVRRLLVPFLTHAYRRPATSNEVDLLLALCESARAAGDSYERTMQLLLKVVLVSPRFLFIGNLDDKRPNRGSDLVAYPIDEWELASRLSYFLWSSMPDAPLLRLAEEGKLRLQLGSQIKRMLRDRRAERFSRHFTGQWLGTRLLKTIEPDEQLFPEYDHQLAHAMTREAESLFSEIVRRDLPITTLLDADFTYLNGRLAKHYGIPGVEGNRFRRVELAGLPASAGLRGGVLTLGGVLAVTSNPNRTSPVKRGKWILGELLGEEPPPPPPNIPSLEGGGRGNDPATLREQLAKHRADPACAACHDTMDPLGLALEKFDALGRWRPEESGRPIDARGSLPGGRQIEGAQGLRRELLRRRGDFRTCFTKKMLTYALGRGLEYYDECAVSEISDRLANKDDRMGELLLAIVESEPFQKRRARTTEESKEQTP